MITMSGSALAGMKRDSRWHVIIIIIIIIASRDNDGG